MDGTMIKELLYNKWFFSFIISWILFLSLVDWRTLTMNIWGGIAASSLEFWQDSIANRMDMYHMHETGISLLNISLFFTFGVVFTMGILFLQFTPKYPKLQFLHIVFFSIGFMTFELIAQSYDMLIKTHWNLLGSLFDNIIIMGSLVWLKQYVLIKSKR
jgi:hypothetical protein